MKKLLFLGLIFSLPVNVFAADFETKSGYVIPEQEYENLLKLHSSEYLYTMSYEEYQYIISLNLDYDNVRTTSKFIYTLCNKLTGECAEEEITEQEYENSAYLPSPLLDSYYESGYKYLTLTLIDSSDGTAYFGLDNLWKHIPATRSYDVMAIRLGNFSVVRGSEHGYQNYKLNGVYDSVSYSANGTNINVLNNGFGISMNIVDSDITYLSNSISGLLSVDAKPAVIYGTYQHAVNDVTLAQSKSYTLGSGGLGSVLKFTGNIGNNYDGMTGVYDYITSY